MKKDWFELLTGEEFNKDYDEELHQEAERAIAAVQEKWRPLLRRSLWQDIVAIFKPVDPQRQAIQSLYTEEYDAVAAKYPEYIAWLDKMEWSQW